MRKTILTLLAACAVMSGAVASEASAHGGHALPREEAVELVAEVINQTVEYKHLPGDWFVGYIGGYPSYCFQGYYLPTVYSQCKAYQMRTSFGYHQHRWGTIQRLPSSYAFYPDAHGWFQ